jgi:hypothetical protein
LDYKFEKKSGNNVVTLMVISPPALAHLRPPHIFDHQPIRARRTKPPDDIRQEDGREGLPEETHVVDLRCLLPWIWGAGRGFGGGGGLKGRRGVTYEDKFVGPSRSNVPWSKGVTAKGDKRIQWTWPHHSCHWCESSSPRCSSTYHPTTSLKQRPSSSASLEGENPAVALERLWQRKEKGRRGVVLVAKEGEDWGGRNGRSNPALIREIKGQWESALGK